MSNIQVITKKGKKKGKNLVILAGIHGNEVCGIEAFNALIPRIKIERGAVTFIYANKEAQRQNKRQIEYNLNRAFYKEQQTEIRETSEGKTAKEIMPYLEKAEMMLDIHASFTPDSRPFVICDKQWLADARIFDTDIASYNWDEFEPGSTDYYMNLQQKPGFCYECGYLGEREATKRAEKAILQFLTFAGALKGKLVKKQDQRVIKIVALYRNKTAPFQKAQEWKDFEELTERSIIRKEGAQEVYGEKGDILLFVRDAKEKGEECFLRGREETLIKPSNKVIA